MRSVPSPSISSSTVSPSWKALRPRWLVPVARMSPGSSVWIDVTHSMQRGILCAMSSVLKFCFSVPLTHSRTCSLCGSGDLVGGDDVRPDRRERVARLHLVEHVAGRRQAARRAVDEIDVAEDVVIASAALTLRGALADHQRHLGLALEDRRRHVGQHHRVAVADDGPGDLWKALIGAGSVRVPSSM